MGGLDSVVSVLGAAEGSFFVGSSIITHWVPEGTAVEGLVVGVFPPFPFPFPGLSG